MASTVKQVAVIGGGIVGICSAIWLQRSGAAVTLIDKVAPGTGNSSGNAGVFARCSVAPVTAPGMIAKSPKLLMDPNFPLYLRYAYLPKLMPWLVKYLSHANDTDTQRISRGLEPLTSDSLEQHVLLSKGTAAEQWIVPSDYSFVYTDKAAFEADSYTWGLRKKAGFIPEILEGHAVREFEPLLSTSLNLLAVMKEHGYVTNPGDYIQALAQEFQNLGGTLVLSAVEDFSMSDGKVVAVNTQSQRVPCEAVVLAAGVWSKTLSQKLGLNVPMESERGYHIIFKSPSPQIRTPLMIASGKFVATPMSNGLRCAGVVEFGGLDAEASEKPLAFLKRKVHEAFPNLTYQDTQTWLGHRPAPSDSLPVIGEIGRSSVFAAFGHHHIGLTSGPKTGKIIADLIQNGGTDNDITAYTPNRFL